MPRTIYRKFGQHPLCTHRERVIREKQNKKRVISVLYNSYATVDDDFTIREHVFAFGQSN